MSDHNYSLTNQTNASDLTVNNIEIPMNEDNESNENTNKWQTYYSSSKRRGNDLQPSDTNKKTRQDNDSQVKLNLQNRYEILADRNKASCSTNSPNDTKENVEGKSATVKEVKSAPIFIPEVTSIKAMEEAFESVIRTDEYSYKCINQNSVKLFTKSSDAYRKIVHLLNETHVKFHTYQLKSERAFRVVLKHIHYSTDPGEIKCSLEQLGYSVRYVTNVRHYQSKQPLSMFYVDLEPNADNKTIFDVQHLLHAKVTFEPPMAKKEIAQCKRCQEYGHTKTYCRHPFRCVKCGQGHDSASCTKPNNTPAVCALCKGDHPSNYKGCAVYKTLQQKEFPQKRQRDTDRIDQNKDTQPPTPPPSRPQSNYHNYAAAVKSNQSRPNHTEDGLTSTINSFFDRFEKLFVQQSQQIGTLLNLLTTLISKMK